jgi:molybdopterin/thiamine biosynthesis adenylyltransferase
MGREAQKRMASSDVLISGLNGLGVEVAKNVTLAGVKSVTLHDSTPTAWSDLAAQFYLTESDLGKPRAAACVSKLAELNRYVKVCCSPLAFVLLKKALYSIEKVASFPVLNAAVLHAGVSGGR